MQFSIGRYLKIKIDQKLSFDLTKDASDYKSIKALGKENFKKYCPYIGKLCLYNWQSV